MLRETERLRENGRLLAASAADLSLKIFGLTLTSASALWPRTQVVAVEAPLRHYWNKQKFVAGMMSAEQSGPAPRVDKLDKASWFTSVSRLEFFCCCAVL